VASQEVVRRRDAQAARAMEVNERRPLSGLHVPDPEAVGLDEALSERGLRHGGDPLVFISNVANAGSTLSRTGPASA